MASLLRATDAAKRKAESTARPTTMSGLFGSAASSAASSSNPTQGDLSKDVAVQNPPEDSISRIRFSPMYDHLAVASWDKKLRIYEIDGNGNSQGKALFEFQAPVLDCCWSKVRGSRGSCTYKGDSC